VRLKKLVIEHGFLRASRSFKRRRKKIYEKGRPKFYQGRINLVPSDALMVQV
jgi:hypothetical protein